MSSGRLPPAMLDELAERFRALGEPARLAILDVLRNGEHSVGQLVEATGQGQANVSRHLAQLHSAGWVTRRREGTFVYYSMTDEEVKQLCDLVCGRIYRELDAVGESLRR